MTKHNTGLLITVQGMSRLVPSMQSYGQFKLGPVYLPSLQTYNAPSQRSQFTVVKISHLPYPYAMSCIIDCEQGYSQFKPKYLYHVTNRTHKLLLYSYGPIKLRNAQGPQAQRIRFRIQKSTEIIFLCDSLKVEHFSVYLLDQYSAALLRSPSRLP